MDVVNSTNSVNAIVGFENGDSYMVKFCNAAGGGTSECNNRDFVFYIILFNYNYQLFDYYCYY